MGEKLVKINRLFHKAMGIVADVSLAGIVLVIAVIVVNRCVFNQGLTWAADAPDLLLTLLAFLFLAWAVRDYIQIGVDLACNWFPHDYRARLRTVFTFDLLALFCGAFLLYFGVRRMPPTAELWTWWRYLPIPMAGLVLSFDSLMFLTGLLLHEDTYIFKRLPEYQQKLRKREQTRKIVMSSNDMF